MKLILLSLFILFLAQHTMAQSSLEHETSINQCNSYEEILNEMLINLNSFEDKIFERRNWLREIKLDLDDTREELKVLSRKCEYNYNQSCESANQRIDQYNNGKRFFEDKIVVLNEMIDRYNEENRYFNTHKRSYQKECRP